MCPDGGARSANIDEDAGLGADPQTPRPADAGHGLDVLVPHYRDIAGLTLSLDSIAAQTWTGDLRVIVVDDGSPKAEAKAARALVADSGLNATFERNSQNRGRPYTRNRLLDLVEGAYVAWLDAGDIWYPDKLTTQFEHLSRLRFQGEDISRIWITCHYDWQWSGQRVRTVEQRVDHRQFRDLMLGRYLRAYLWTLLGPAEVFRAAGRFDERLPRLQDLDYFLRFVHGGGKLSTPPGNAALCRYHKSDVGRDATEIRACNRLIQEKYRPVLQGYGPAFMKTIRYNAERLSARYAANNGARLTSGYYHGRAVLAHPKRALGAARFWLVNSEG